MERERKKILFVMAGTSLADKVRENITKSVPECEIIHSSGAAEAISRCEKTNFDLIVCDYYLPNINGIEMLKMLKKSNINIPFILIVDFQSQALIIKALKEGAIDAIIYDPAFDEILPFFIRKNLAFIEAKEELEKLKKLYRNREIEMEGSSIYDNFTLLYNKRFMIKRIEDENNRSKRYNRPLCIFLIDIDHLSEINRLYNKKAGDIVIQKVASILKNTLRKTDIIGRYIDDEFVVILPETPVEKASLIAEKIINNVRKHDFHAEGKKFNISISIGTGWYPRFGKDNHEELLAAAGKALIKAKKDGGNIMKIAGMFDLR